MPEFSFCLFKFKISIGEEDDLTYLWMGYCAFHLGDYRRAMEVVLSISSKLLETKQLFLNMSC